MRYRLERVENFSRIGKRLSGEKKENSEAKNKFQRRFEYLWCHCKVAALASISCCIEIW